jgi:hypothetical protein
MANYKAEFFDKLLTNIKGLEGKLTTDENHNLTHSIENTCYWAEALHQTFCDMSDVIAMLAMGASCDFSPIKDKKS